MSKHKETSKQKTAKAASVVKSSRRWIWMAALVFGVVVVAWCGWYFYGGAIKQDSSMTYADEPIPGKTPNSSDVSSSANTVSGEAPDKDSARGFLNLGLSLMNEGKLDEAVEQFRLAEARNPKDEDVHFNLGIALARQGKTEEARHHYEEALKILPKYIEAHNNLGNLLVKENKLDEASTHFLAALQVNSSNATAHNNLGTVLGRQMKYEAAMQQFQQAVDLMPTYAEARFNLANMYLLARKPGKAAEEFSEVLKLKPGFEPAVKGLEKARLYGTPGALPPTNFTAPAVVKKDI